MSRVAELYDQCPEYEWGRLARTPYHTLEFTVFMHHITSNLVPRSFILDAGGGPGRYTIELARRGHDVILYDISREEIALARAHVAEESPEVRDRVVDCIVGDVRDLSAFEDETFDAVLCLDPLTYLADPVQRDVALAEIVRVAKRSAIVAVGVRGYLGVLRTILTKDPESLTNGSLENLTASGNIDVQGVPCHFYPAREIRDLAIAHGLDVITMAGAEGLSDGLADATNALHEDHEKWSVWENLILDTSTDAAIVDISSHILLLGRKK